MTRIERMQIKLLECDLNNMADVYDEGMYYGDIKLYDDLDKYGVDTYKYEQDEYDYHNCME